MAQQQNGRWNSTFLIELNWILPFSGAFSGRVGVLLAFSQWSWMPRSFNYSCSADTFTVLVSFYRRNVTHSQWDNSWQLWPYEAELDNMTFRPAKKNSSKCFSRNLMPQITSLLPSSCIWPSPCKLLAFSKGNYHTMVAFHAIPHWGGSELSLVSV